MIRNLSLAWKLIILILSSTAVIFVAAFTYNYHFSNQTVLKNVEENARNLAYSTVYKIESVLQAVEKIPKNLASIIENYPYEREDLLRLAYSTVSTNPEIFGSAVAFEPYAFNSDTYYFSPYCYKEKGQTLLTVLGSDTYNYFHLDWYQIPKELKRPIWTEPYYDEGGGDIITSTYSVPFYKEGKGDTRTFGGIVTADISLMWLTEIVSSVKIYQSGYAFLITQNGVIVTHPEEQLIMRESIFSIAEAKGDLRLRELGQAMIRGDEDFIPIKDFVSGKQSWMYYAPLPASDWTLGVIFPEAELFADLHRLSRTVILIGVFGFAFLCLVIVTISGTITKPLRYLARTTSEIAKGNLDIELPEVAAKDEIGELTRSFRNMKVALKEYITNLTETTAAKERIESELKIAHTIQMSFLPKQFPPFPEKDSFDIYAELEPAREVGGDLYDFFLLDDEHLFVVVGDVSDKGVAAALFMAVTKTLMKGVAAPNLDPSEILARVNVELCLDNETMMFVTVFCGVLNLTTGAIRYSNAGHNPPVLFRLGQDPQWLELPKGTTLGVMENAEYQTVELKLNPGDTLLAYTDGVTEAMDTEETLYSDQRLLQTLEGEARTSPEEMVKHVLESVQKFAEGAPQADDITVLAVRFKGVSKRPN